jgi:hypothetical protein
MFFSYFMRLAIAGGVTVSAAHGKITLLGTPRAAGCAPGPYGARSPSCAIDNRIVTVPPAATHSRLIASRTAPTLNSVPGA